MRGKGGVVGNLMMFRHRNKELTIDFQEKY